MDNGKQRTNRHADNSGHEGNEWHGGVPHSSRDNPRDEVTRTGAPNGPLAKPTPPAPSPGTHAEQPSEEGTSGGYTHDRRTADATEARRQQSRPDAAIGGGESEWHAHPTSLYGAAGAPVRRGNSGRTLPLLPAVAAGVALFVVGGAAGGALGVAAGHSSAQHSGPGGNGAPPNGPGGGGPGGGANQGGMPAQGSYGGQGRQGSQDSQNSDADGQGSDGIGSGAADRSDDGGNHQQNPAAVRSPQAAARSSQAIGRGNGNAASSVGNIVQTAGITGTPAGTHSADGGTTTAVGAAVTGRVRADVQTMRRTASDIASIVNVGL